ncbi:MAG TPA: hypothetical protein VGM79_10005 [Streptosporangiaceae bacterium]|jgi:hypothetical protein
MTAGGLAQLDPEHLAHARRVADAILYEGYLLYPYRQSAVKNQARFQFGVLMPPGYAAVDPHESRASQTECLLECGEDAQVTVVARFLQFQDRVVQAISPETGELHEVGALYVDGLEHTTWNEAAEREQHLTAVVGTMLAADQELEFTLPAGEEVEPIADSAGRPAGRLVRRWAQLDGAITLHAERVAGPYQALRLRIRLENRSRPARLAARDDGLRHALIAAHLLVGAPGGRFLSLTDPPEWASAEVAQCENAGTWPVLAGPPDCADLLLSSPVILYDHPEVAAESAGDLFDATEIDEILTLRTLALTDAEKREARSTDSRAADLLDRLDHLPPEMLDRMHGAIRYLRSVPGQARAPEDTSEPPVFATPDTPWWDPGADGSVSPDTDHVVVAGHRVARGSRVLMRPGSRRADAQDLFLAGREAQVEAVLHDVDGQVHLAVTPVDDPAADLQRSHGRFLYFAPDEVEPLGPRGSYPGEHSQMMGPGGEGDQ